MITTNRASRALQVLHYLVPLAVVAYFAAAKTVAACLLHKSDRPAVQGRRSAIFLLSVSTILCIAQGILYISAATGNHSAIPTQDRYIYAILATFAYSSLLLGLIETKRPVWYVYFGSWLVGLLGETGCLVCQIFADRGSYRFWLIALHSARAFCLLGLTLLGAVLVLRSRQKSTKKQGESESLLANGNGHATGEPETYGTANGNSARKDDIPDDDDDYDIDSDSEEPAEDRKLKKEQRKRLEGAGNWLNYLADFKVFIPMLWPSKDRFVQACLATVAVVLVAGRFLNILVPRALGNLTNELARTAGDGIVPWHQLGMWMLWSWLNSSVGISLIQSLAELPVQQFAFKSIGSTAFGHIMGLSMDFHNEKNSGELIRAIEQGQNLQGLLEFIAFQVGPMFLDLVISFVYVYTLFDVYMTLILLAIGLSYVWIGAKTTSWSIKQRRQFNTALRNESKVQNEAINNWQTVSHFNRGAYEVDRYRTTLDDFNKAEWRYYVSFYLGGSSQSLVMLVGRLAAHALAAYRIAQGRAPIGHFVTLTAYWRTVEGPLASVSWSIRRVSQMLTDSERLLQLMLTKPSVTNAPNATQLVVKAGEVTFDHVDFSYDPRKPTLKDVSFTARPGQTIALVGETGGGKSTILKLLYRYYDINGGAIRIDGQDIRNVTLDSLRDSFGMVPQDPSLFNVTLMDNIKYARLDATDDEVKEACKAAAIHDKIESFPDSYASKVGERGVKLSGGELQRVAIARAILRQPQLVLLDEATSMIDAETESLIQKAFRRLTSGRTTFVVAHRLSTIQHADLILVVSDGKIVEHGTHEQLFRKNGKYVALWSKQLSKNVGLPGGALEVTEDDEALIDVDTQAPDRPHAKQ
ncbi:putative ABC transporter [Hortaea werneckii]|nr:putative ABC transporter [Hortaea werneckii]